ncbi:MAG: HAMP domain-containing protein, partial [Verrucomicrobiae bacterium]|nr:HAMP domain-containing protein [Verrucomicrobiae bacterium]
MKSLSSRLTVWYAVSITMTAALFMFFGHYHLRQNYIAGLDLLNDTEFGDILPTILVNFEEGNPQATIDAIELHTERDASLFFFQVGQNHDHTIFTSHNLGGHALPPIVHNQRRVTISDPNLGTLRVGEYHAAGLDIHIASSLQGLMALEDNMLRVAFMGLIAIFLASMGIGYALSRYALKPIAVIERTAARITASNLGERIPAPDTEDEIARLTNLLNTMFDRLQASFQQVQRFTADASHELKTPLSLIRINTEEMLSKLDSPEAQRQESLSNQLNQIDRLNKVINDLLILAKADAGALKVSPSLHSCKDFLEDFAQDATALCEDKGLEIEVDNAFNGSTTFDPLWIRHLLFNLLANAINASPEGGKIVLISQKVLSDWEIQLMDEGKGIPEDKLETVFERFFQENSGSSTRGSGLGLPICKSIAQLHHGSIQLENRKNQRGLKIIIRLPLSDSL